MNSNLVINEDLPLVFQKGKISMSRFLVIGCQDGGEADGIDIIAHSSDDINDCLDAIEKSNGFFDFIRIFDTGKGAMKQIHIPETLKALRAAGAR